MHAILGFFSLALVVTSGFIGLHLGGWTINSKSSLHSKVGFSVFVMGLALIFAGIAANIIRLKVSMPWKTKQVLLVGKVHKWFGRGVVIFSQFANGTGAYHFCTRHTTTSMGWWIAGGSAVFFFTFLVIGECVY